MMAAMLTITLTEPATATAHLALVVVDPHDDSLVHAHIGCPELADLVDRIEVTTATAVDDPDELDAAVADLGLALPLDAAIGLRSCPACWGD
jgi:hypothetical protein